MHVACHHHRAIHCHLFYFSYRFHMILLTCSLNQNHAHICPIMFKWATPLAWGYVSSLWALARIHHHLIDANQHASILSPFRTFSLFNVSDIILQPLIISSIASCLLDFLAALSFFYVGNAILQGFTLSFFQRLHVYFPATKNPTMNWMLLQIFVS